jgi:hypothetical protein
MKVTIGHLRRLINEAFTNPPGDWLYFHITHEDRGKIFTFTPRTPSWNTYTDAEDFTTPRVSLATSVEKAVHGKFGSGEPEAFGQPEMFVYASKSAPHLFVPSDGANLGTSNNPWGPDWSFATYAKENNIEFDRKIHADLVKGHITDDPKSTGEIWSLAPIKMTLVGRLWPSSIGAPRVHQKWLLRPHSDE